MSAESIVWRMSVWCCLSLLWLLATVCSDLYVIAITAQEPALPKESDYYRLIDVSLSKSTSDSRAVNWTPAPDGVPLEISGLELVDDRRLAVAIRKGEVWFLDGVYDDPPTDVRYHRFASALHEPLGLVFHDGSFYTAQRTEVTRLRDADGDDVADEYLTAAKGWGITGQYHEYAYGPKLAKDGSLWLTLNIGMGLKPNELALTVHNPKLNYRQAPWRGWGMRIDPCGKLIPECAGMRSPCGLGANADGEMFYSDQQGNWVATNALHHLRRGAFYHHPEALASMDLPGSPIRNITRIPAGVPLPDALRQFPQMKPPAVWFPYKKMGQSTTDIMLDDSHGKFGPFPGQFFVGEFTQASINRVYLEKIDGEYQGACFPFRRGFGCAVLRMVQGTDGSIFAGLTNRGWSSLGTASYGLQRLVWTGQVPFEIKEMRAQPDGFELQFTLPVDPASAADVGSYELSSYTYLYRPDYGSDEVQTKALSVRQAVVSPDGLTVRLIIDPLRPYFVHELNAAGVRAADGRPLLHSQAYYTLNKIPRR